MYVSPSSDANALSEWVTAVARELGRSFVLVDRNPEAIAVMRRRLPHARVATSVDGPP